MSAWGHAALNILGQEGDIVRLGAAIGQIAGDAAARRRLDGHFRLAIAIEVIHHELGVMRASTDVHAHIHPPQQRTIELDAVDIALARIALDGHILGVVGIPLDEQLILPITVYIAHGEVIGGVFKGLSGGGNAALGLVQRDIQIAIGPGLYRGAGGKLLPLQQCCHGVFILRRTCLVRIIGAIRDGRDNFTVAQDEEIRTGEALLLRTAHFLPQEAPGQVYPIGGLHGHEATVKFFQLRLHIVILPCHSSGD